MHYEMTNQILAADGTMAAQVRVPPGSAWFDGHFPGLPVLPGIAQLGMVVDLIRGMMGSPVRVAEVNRVRFKQMIRPDDRLSVVVEPKPSGKGGYGFRILKHDEVVCSGAIKVEEK
ncbi:MAG: hypothetical protein M0036_19850 [Desulfobacteraceae bacterium]|nr:hypothetical protein [Desulfobacteraceae bacterium]